MKNNDQEAESNGINNITSSCSACKYQRKRCKPDCILRKYFPSNKYEEFKNVQKVFGIANIMKKIKEANNSAEAERAIVESLYWEGEAWAKDPFNGPLGVVKVKDEALMAKDEELNELRSAVQRMQAFIGANSVPNPNMMNVNYPSNAGLFLDSYVSGSYARNGFQQRFLQHGSGLVNNQRVIEHGNWMHRNGIEQWREQQGIGNFGPSSNFVTGTEMSRADATNQDFGSEKSE